MNEKIKMFIQDIVKLNDLSSSCADIMIIFSGLEDEIIKYNKDLKLKLLQETTLGGDNSIQNQLKQIKDKNLLQNPRKKIYRFNPDLQKAISSIKQGKEVELKISYTDGRNITYEITELSESDVTTIMEIASDTTISTATRGRPTTPKPENWLEHKREFLEKSQHLKRNAKATFRKETAIKLHDIYPSISIRILEKWLKE